MVSDELRLYSLFPKLLPYALCLLAYNNYF